VRLALEQLCSGVALRAPHAPAGHGPARSGPLSTDEPGIGRALVRLPREVVDAVVEDLLRPGVADAREAAIGELIVQWRVQKRPDRPRPGRPELLVARAAFEGSQDAGQLRVPQVDPAALGGDHDVHQRAGGVGGVPDRPLPMDTVGED